MNDLLFRIMTTLLILVMMGISVYHRRKADRLGGDKISLKGEGLIIAIALRLVGFGLWISVFAYLINPAWVAWARIDLPEWARWLGILMGIVAVCMCYWIFSSLGTNITPTVVTRRTHTLVTSGPYRWVRHPLYVMGVIAFAGFALVAESWWIALMGVIVFGILAVRTRKEEAQLIERFGDEYRAYMQSTGRFLPIVQR
jgi:protein-S-isoprenylcysteine O-methyltransferase Ste14